MAAAGQGFGGEGDAAVATVYAQRAIAQVKACAIVNANEPAPFSK